MHQVPSMEKKRKSYLQVPVKRKKCIQNKSPKESEVSGNQRSKMEELEEVYSLEKRKGKHCGRLQISETLSWE